MNNSNFFDWLQDKLTRTDLSDYLGELGLILLVLVGAFGAIYIMKGSMEELDKNLSKKVEEIEAETQKIFSTYEIRCRDDNKKIIKIVPYSYSYKIEGNVIHFDNAGTYVVPIGATCELEEKTKSLD